MELAVKEWVFNQELRDQIVRITGYSPETDSEFDDTVFLVKSIHGDQMIALGIKDQRVYTFYLYEFSEDLKLSLYGSPEYQAMPEAYMKELNNEDGQGWVIDHALKFSPPGSTPDIDIMLATIDTPPGKKGRSNENPS